MLAILGRCLVKISSLLVGITAIACGDSISLPMSRDRCQSQPGFVYGDSGPFQAGSDGAERDYGYQISAAALGVTPEAMAQAEARLRQQGWFDRERQATQIDQPAFCIAANLVSQATHQEFVAATGYRRPWNGKKPLAAMTVAIFPGAATGSQRPPTGAAAV